MAQQQQQGSSYGGGQRRRSGAKQPEHRAALLARGYELQCVRGRGNFAQVWEARHLRTGLKVAIKIIRLLSANKVAREVRLMRLLKHPHIIQLYEAILDEEHAYLVMELAELGQLHDYVVLHGRLAEGEARRIFQQLVSAIAYCHHNMVAHRDLKLENILLDSERNVKTVDLGFSNLFSHTKLLTASCGSPEYAAPELHEGREYMGPEVDVWSCGIILYVLLCGALPFDAADRAELQRSIRRGEYSIPAHVSDEARDLISSMLIVRPDKRASITEVTAHRWLRFRSPIPRYLAMPPLHTSTQIIKVEDETVQQVARQLGFDSNSLVQSIENGIENEATVCYKLILSRRLDAATRYLRTVDMYHVDVEAAAELRPLRGRRVARALQELHILILHQGYDQGGCCYRMICARFPGIPTDSGSDSDSSGPAQGALQTNNHILESSSAALLFEIQLYESGGGEEWNCNRCHYAMDLKRLSGPQPQFLHICSLFASKLRDIN